jgi:hypothetical protein
VGFVLSGPVKFPFMKTKRTKLLTRFEPETRFDVPPSAPVPFRGTRETELEQLKNRLLRDALNATTHAQFYAPLRRAANEAAAVAWMTPFPLLFLPALFEEVAARALRQFELAEGIRARSRRILSVVN